MTVTAMRHRPAAAARRFGYGVAATINIVLLYLVDGHPGWAAVPFLTERTADVIPLVNASLIVGLAVDLVQMVRDPRWLVALGGMATTVIGTVVLVQLWRVFPFDFGAASPAWVVVTRIVLGLGIAGSLIGFLTQAVSLAHPSRDDPPCA